MNPKTKLKLKNFLYDMCCKFEGYELYQVEMVNTFLSQQSSREMCGSRYGELIFQAWVRLKGAERSKYIGCALRLIHLYVLRSRLSQTECEFSFSIFANGV